jgi:hypothetical protein
MVDFLGWMEEHLSISSQPPPLINERVPLTNSLNPLPQAFIESWSIDTTAP